MLGQLVGAVAPAAATAMSAPQMRLLANARDAVASDEPETVDVLGMLPISLPVATFDVAAGVKNALTQDMTLELQLSRDAGRVSTLAIDAQGLKNLTAASAASGDASSTFDSALSPQASTEAQPLRAASVEPNVSRPLHSPVGSSAWADELGARLTMMAEQGKHTASLRLSPEHLGPLEIRIAIRDDQASVWFGAAHADTRAAIEHALPRLRELFESQGLSLTDAGVFKEPPREQAAARARAGSEAHESHADESSAPARVNLNLTLIDAYA